MSAFVLDSGQALSGAGTAIVAVALMFVVAGLVVLFLAGRSAWANYRMQRRALSHLRVQYEAEYRGVGLTVFTHHRPEAFSAGLRTPRLYLSSEALRAETAELAAVIEHEFHHCRRRDPLRLLLAQVLSDCLFFVPWMRGLSGRYSRLVELAADEAAVARGAGRGTLAAALLAFGGDSRPGVVGIAPERVDHLCGEMPDLRLPRAIVVCTVAVVFGLWMTALAVLCVLAF